MSTPHNSAAKGEIAKTVLMPGDPLRAQFIAENFLTDAKLVNNVRGIHGNSNYMAQFGMPGTFAPIADFELLETAVAIAREKGVRMPVGNVLSSDNFYDASGKTMDWAKMGVLCAEMESAALYANAAYLGKRALSLLTISDSIVTGEEPPAADRQTTFTQMMEIALGVAVAMAKKEG